MKRPLTCVEICAGAGGQALGLAMAGFVHVALVEYEKEYCEILKQNRPEWNVIWQDVCDFNGSDYAGVDLLAGGVPCPPFSVAGKQLGKDDERDLFPEAIRLTKEIKPRAVMLENVRGFLDPRFDEYRENIFAQLKELGYVTHIKLLNASDYGVPQLRPRVVIVGIRKDQCGAFSYPEENTENTVTVGEKLYDLMDEVIRKLNQSGRLLIIDEAENLPYRALEITRRIHDKTGIGILLVGRGILLENLKGYNNQYDQLYSRVKFTKVIDKILIQDVIKILESIGQDSKLAEIYLQYSEGNTRRLEHLISHSISIAKFNGKAEVDDVVIKQTSKLLMA